MKAVRIHNYGGQEQLIEENIEKPRPAAGQVIVKQHATSINPIDWKLRAGYLQDMVPFEFPVILGWDTAGIIDEVADDVTDFEIGDRVFARPELTNQGTYAEYTAVDAHLLAHIPENLTFQEAAGVPLTTMTAWQCLYDFADIQPGDKVLIHAGAGGVGTMAIQLAKVTGAKVVTTASTHNVEFLYSLGADKVIDYKKQDFDDELEDVDFVLDTLGGEIQERSYKVLKNGGQLASIAAPPEQEQAEAHGVKAGFVWLEPVGEQMRAIAKLLEDEKIKPIVGHQYPLSEQGIRDAHALSETHHAKGKIIIDID
ncbi:NADP-dependent oxidoreductase [Alkalibacillus salilacus]|uniref:NADPH:quinone reductase-like Zn-dependent oxidoreductase n=1 Tax=Alkalibacillus salilacus TaxID=284582 RepID=A0ABT9VBJ9_9BACI|nr:NADP-dependent oxidoreductase [Alkalibacillus salilacus]MDQ0158190.1 NADPH:quinone reductase-like Zn-dependent oxidoreductase [Alkalibacillus salilacus]